uniref:Sphingomyelin synthase-like domain-containing protein n=1 Tax=Timema shepardi TaxID=629360 RepID=A0A7R9G1M4_TIMSH|nr:unnamed protein product [Timema shepardi]
MADVAMMWCEWVIRDVAMMWCEWVIMDVILMWCEWVIRDVAMMWCEWVIRDVAMMWCEWVIMDVILMWCEWMIRDVILMWCEWMIRDVILMWCEWVIMDVILMWCEWVIKDVAMIGCEWVITDIAMMMVLDSKGGNHSDYGSFHTASDHHTVDIKGVPHQSSDDPTLHSDTDSVRLTTDMTQSDLYQRQPLLPPSAKTDSWKSSNGLHSPTSEYYDSDDKTDGHRNGTAINGVIKIDVPAPLREEPRFPKEKWKTFIAFIILVVNFILTTASLSLVHERVPDREKYAPLPDIVLDNVNAMDWALDVSEILIMIATFSSLVVLIFHKHRFIVMRRVFLLLSLLYLMRSITMYVTVLPVASKTYYCSPKLNSTSTLVVVKRVWQLISGFGLSINGQHTYCGDYIYSGHTVILVLSYLIISELATEMFSIPLGIMVSVNHWCDHAHGHYTVDILIAYYVTTTLFWAYHTMANNSHLKQSGPNNFLARMWWFRLFQYLEKNVGGPVPRQYEWPLPWPRRCHGKHPNRNS